jgi:hypothetical protein
MGRLLASVLPLLAVLACPVMMLLLCLRAMRGHGSLQQPAATSTHGPPDSTTERITALERELAVLRADRDHDASRPPPAAGPAASLAPSDTAPAETAER